MGKMNWGRIFLGGVLWFVVYEVLGGTTWWLFLRAESIAAVESLGRPFPATVGFLVFFLLGGLAVGIFALWLYAAIRPRYGPGPKTAARTALALWVIAGLLPAAFWFRLLLLPTGLLVGTLAGALVAAVVATLVGAWLYQE
jgi:hypothetical protein